MTVSVIERIHHFSLALDTAFSRDNDNLCQTGIHDYHIYYSEIVLIFP